ncbi:hypothetical protein HFA01_37840 [Halobacillus faecis]|uniref:Uncharacterized protein n=1 Tax=Halobacillus faecis TaxID=360184 RepID=A0A511WZ59_9BACI|nr:hypothetical protein HFA01_37840 [Halobacillus faecis]
MIKYYTRKDVAEFFDVTLNDVDKWIKQGKLIETEKGIATSQIRTREQILRVDSTFFIRREAELNQIPRKRNDTKDRSQ